MRIQTLTAILDRMVELKAIRKDLSFGCGVIYEGRVLIFIKREEDLPVGKRIYTFIDNSSGNIINAVEEEVEKNMEILGHEPALIDELRALENAGYHYALHEDGVLVVMEKGSEVASLKRNLSLPYLHQQDQEYGDAFLSLLVG